MTTPTPMPGDQGPTPADGGAGDVPPTSAQPGGYGQPGQWGQQDQPGGYGQWGQQDQPGGYGQWGQQGGYGQQGQQPGDQQSGWGAAPEPPSYGAPDPQAYGQFGAPGQMPMVTAPQPGIVPLRPLSLGEIYDGAFRAIRANPPVMFGLAAVVVAVVTILQSVLTWNAFEDLYRIAGQATPTEADLEEVYGTLVASIVPSLAGTVLGFVATTILNGVLIHSVSQSVIGRTLPLKELWDLVRPQLLKLLLLTLLISVAAAAVMLVCLLPGFLGLLGGDINTGAGLLLLGIPLGLAGLLFVVVATVLATPALVLERAGVLTALRRSWQLTRPMFWRVTGIYLLTSILVAVVSAVISTPVGMLGQLLGGPTAMTIAQLAGSTVAAAVTTPFMAAVVALLYIDIRIRREGLDVDLAAAAAEQA